MTAGKPLKLKASAVRPDAQGPRSAPNGGWKILVVDDDREVHSVTRMILSKLRFDGSPLSLLDAYTAAEAEDILRREPNIAILLLDVVMETDDAGLRLVRRIRESMGNKALRIVLRTGQPGEAPEEKVIIDYDINDYKAKSELTAQKLFTTVISALRAYRDIVALERNRRGLEVILDSSDSLFRAESMRSFASGVLEQLSTFIGCRPNGILCVEGAVPTLPSVGNTPCAMRVVAACGEYTDCMTCALGHDCRHAEIIQLMKSAIERRSNIYGDQHTVVYLEGAGTTGIAALIHGDYRAGSEGRELLDVFASKISVGLSNITHYETMLLAKKKAEAALRARSDLLATMSHELRTPLNAILGFSQMILADDGTVALEKHRQSLSYILDSGNHLLALITAVLDYIETDSAPPADEGQPFGIKDAVTACLDRVRAAAERRPVSVSLVAPAGGWPSLTGSRSRLETVLDQLLSNAVKFNRPKGNVVVSIEPGKDRWVVSVADDGPGIPADSRKRVFEPFFRLGEVMTADAGGCGIGLALAQRLAETMDCRLWADANPGGGAIFRLELPVNV